MFVIKLTQMMSASLSLRLVIVYKYFGFINYYKSFIDDKYEYFDYLIHNIYKNFFI